MPALDPEQVEYLRTAFLERVAHEIHGPLGVLLGALEELEQLSSGAPAESARFLAIARRAAARLRRVGDRLRQTAQLERSVLERGAQRLDLRALLERAVAEAKALEANPRIAVELSGEPEAVPLWGDEGWIRMACMELTANALRHARERVRVELSARGGGGEIHFLDDHATPASFAPGRFRAPVERRGLGVSLGLVREVARAHGGELVIEPDRGLPPHGSRVRLCLRPEQVQ